MKLPYVSLSGPHVSEKIVYLGVSLPRHSCSTFLLALSKRILKRPTNGSAEGAWVPQVLLARALIDDYLEVPYESQLAVNAEQIGWSTLPGLCGAYHACCPMSVHRTPGTQRIRSAWPVSSSHACRSRKPEEAAKEAARVRPRLHVPKSCTITLVSGSNPSLFSGSSHSHLFSLIWTVLTLLLAPSVILFHNRLQPRSAKFA